MREMKSTPRDRDLCERKTKSSRAKGQVGVVCG
jgi:hypothetical protein